MKIGIVGYQGSGKSTLFHWLTGEAPDPALVHRTQAAMCAVPEPRVADVCRVYHPKKVTLASLELVDTPGLSRTHEGSAGKLAMIREAGCLVIVLAAFEGSDPAGDLSNFQDDLLIADLDIVTGRVERLRESIRKPRPNRDDLESQLHALVPLQEALDQGRSLRSMDLTVEQKRITKSFQLFSEKPRLVVVNTRDDDDSPDRWRVIAPSDTPLFAISLLLQRELAEMAEGEREEFCREMRLQPSDRDGLIRAIMDASGQMLFFTAGDKEVRTWMIHKGGTALEAAENIHTDLARGFIRAETMKVEDLARLGSEREVKAQHLMRQEPRDYVIQDGDILLIRHN
jgi:ribosome-binding ATPase